MPSALFLTSQFFAYAGSEIVILESAECLVDKGFSVDIAAAVIGAPLSYQAVARGINVIHLNGMVDVSKYDIVWCQHGTLANIQYQTLYQGDKRPLIVSAHLSPFALYEQKLHPLEEDVCDLIVFNSVETRDAMEARFSHGNMRVFYNACPKAYWVPRTYSDSIKRITCVTNHLCEELIHVLLHFEKDLGVDVSIIGDGHDQYRVSPKTITESDLVISIGKTIPYCLASRTPAYVYDIHGGPGWITETTMEESARYNFSGRPHRRTCSSKQIFDELNHGFAAATHYMQGLDESFLAKYRLELFMDCVVEEAMRDKKVIALTEAQLGVMQAAEVMNLILQSKHQEAYRHAGRHPYAKLNLRQYYQ